MNNEVRKVYISGPMTGIQDLNYPAFFAAEAELKSRGYTVLNPAREPNGLTYREYMARAVSFVLMADIVVTLPNVHKSPGARAEIALAASIQLPIMTLEVLLKDSCRNR